MAETVAGSKTKLGWHKSEWKEILQCLGSARIQRMESSSSDDDAVVPGVNNMGTGNLRPKQRARRPREVKPKVTGKKPTVEEPPSTTSLSVQDLSQSLDERRLGPAGLGVRRRGQVSLKDLCVEDKQRIANLIKELARVGEDREKARQDLEKERQDYERQILKLVEQQEQILKERQGLERHLQECQQLLASSQPIQNPLPPHLLPVHPYPHPHPLPFPTQLPIVQPPQWKGSPPRVNRVGHDPGHSMVANIGSPQGDAGSSSAGGGGDGGEAAAAFRYQQQCQIQTSTNNNSNLPPGPSLHPDPRLSAVLYNHDLPHPHPFTDAYPHHSLKHQRHHQLLQQEQMQHYHPHHTQPKIDFFTGMVPEPLPREPEGIAARNAKDTHLASIPATSSKEEIIHRFLASQAAANDDDDNNNNRPSPSLLKRKDSGAKPRGKGSSSKPGVFHPPIMSSTQKSAEIVDYLSVDSRQDCTAPVADQGRNGGDRWRVEEEEGRRGAAAGRVVFVEGEEADGPLHTPPDAGGRGWTDTAHQYRKMTQTQRKEQLIQQRRQLLQEQQRLKHVLSEQEAMLKEKQRALNARARHRGNDDAEANDGRGDDIGACEDDPLGLTPQRLAIDAALERQRAIVDSLEMEAEHRNSATYPKSTSSPQPPPPSPPQGQVENSGPARGNQPDRLRPERGEGGRRRCEERGGGFTAATAGVQKAVNPSNKFSDVVCKLEYTLHSDSEVGKAEEGYSNDGDKSLDDSVDDNEEHKGRVEEAPHASSPQRQDVGTSVSYHTIPRSTRSAEDHGYTDRQDGNQAFSASHPPPSRQAATPGEKTMSVLEIINSMGSPPPSHRRQQHQLSPFMPKLSPRQAYKTSSPPSAFVRESSPSTLPYRELPPLTKWRDDNDDDDSDVEIVVVDYSGDLEDMDESVSGREEVNNEALEESQILEDIFFLK